MELTATLKAFDPDISKDRSRQGCASRAYLFPQSVKLITFAAAPLVLTPFVRNRSQPRDLDRPTPRSKRVGIGDREVHKFLDPGFLVLWILTARIGHGQPSLPAGEALRRHLQHPALRRAGGQDRPAVQVRVAASDGPAGRRPKQ